MSIYEGCFTGYLPGAMEFEFLLNCHKDVIHGKIANSRQLLWIRSNLRTLCIVSINESIKGDLPMLLEISEVVKDWT